MTAVSGFLKRRTLEWLDVSKDIRVIPNFVDTDVFRPAKRRGAPAVVHVSNFRAVKRSADAIRAFCLVRKRRAARLVVIGDGPERPAVEALAKRLRLDVEFRGEERAIEALLGRASVLLSASEFEGFGLAPLEAMACGAAVVATDAGGISEVLGDTGLIAPVGDVEALAQRTIEALDRPELGAAGRERAIAHFRPEVVVPQYERLYRELLDSREVARA